MKKIKYIITIVLILTLVSCKSKKNLIKDTNSNITTTQVVNQIDTTKWIREILDIINKQITYIDKSTVTTATANDTITTTKNDIELVIRVDIAKDETIKEDKNINLTDSTTTINTSNVKDVKDTRLIQGIEWVYVIFTSMVVIGLIVIFASYRR